VNTGWSGGAYGVGKRMELSSTRAIVDAIHEGRLAQAPTQRDPVFGFDIVTACPNVPPAILQPRQTWPAPAVYDRAARALAELFRKNFAAFESGASPEVRAAGPAA
jgi:phosphoenolpyruvate carboxykinase (ATP)